MKVSKKKQFIIRLLSKELQRALGCTEPIAITYAVARAVEILGVEPKTLHLYLSTNIIKNTMGAAVPCTGGMSGIEIAALCGAFGADPSYGLEIYSSISASSITKAKQHVGKDMVKIALKKKVPNSLYIEVKAQSDKASSKVIIAYEHTFITHEYKNRKCLLQREYHKISDSLSSELDPQITLKDMVDFCLEEPLSLKELFEESILLAKNISEEGLKQDIDYGLAVGKTLWENMQNGLLQEGLANYVIAKTSAGVDVRMDGGNFPVISNSGSGNQGITTTMGVVSAAEYLKIEDQNKIIQAVAISNSISIYIKQHLDRLSAICGVTIAATGVSCGIAYLLGGNLKTFEKCIQNMIGTVTGMFCDGAKPGCASKTATCLSAAVTAAILAINDKGLNQRNGILNNNAEDSIKTLGKISAEGRFLDDTILDSMLHK